MHKTIEKVCSALETLSLTVTNAWSGDQTLCEAFGWNCPAITRKDLAEIASNLSNRLKQLQPDQITDALLIRLKDAPQQILHMQANTVPQLFGGNCAQASSAYVNSLFNIEKLIEPLFSWQTISDSKQLPPQLARRLRSLQAELDQIAPNKEELSRQIQLIQEATAASESLPTDMQALTEARAKVNDIAIKSAEHFGAIQSKNNDTEKLINLIKIRKDEADKYILQCEEAYRATTSKGLAAAFSLRAKHLERTMAAWVFGLLAALFTGAYIGSHRIEALTAAMARDNAQWAAIWIQIFLSVLSVGAPLWFAWLATKQISQLFRLTEDYSFKASVANAYEGYRKEAARIDKAFEARLFSSALLRLEEAPLRLTENTTHGSPWHELVTSEPFRNAMNGIPELRDKFVEITKQGLSSLKETSLLSKNVKNGE